MNVEAILKIIRHHENHQLLSFMFITIKDSTDNCQVSNMRNLAITMNVKVIKKGNRYFPFDRQPIGHVYASRQITWKLA